jgi:hypothetical protein
VYLSQYCDCNDCETIQCGPTRGGMRFVQQMLTVRVEEMKKERDREDSRWIGIEPWMGDHDDDY